MIPILNSFTSNPGPTHHQVGTPFTYQKSSVNGASTDAVALGRRPSRVMGMRTAFHAVEIGRRVIFEATGEAHGGVVAGWGLVGPTKTGPNYLKPGPRRGSRSSAKAD